MGKLIRCHFYYLLNKVTLVIFIISSLSVIFFSIFSALSFDDRSSLNVVASEYYISVYEIIKLTNFILVIILFGYSFSSLCDGYHAITISKQNPRSKYLLSKLILLLCIFTFLYFLSIAIVVIISLSFKIILSEKMLISFLNLYVILIYYGLLSTLLIMVVDNIYIVFVLVPLSFIDHEKKLYFLTYILPIEDKNKIARTLILPLWYYIILIIFITLLINLLWSRKDLS